MEARYRQLLEERDYMERNRPALVVPDYAGGDNTGDDYGIQDAYNQLMENRKLHDVELEQDVKVPTTQTNELFSQLVMGCMPYGLIKRTPCTPELTEQFNEQFIIHQMLDTFNRAKFQHKMWGGMVVELWEKYQFDLNLERDGQTIFHRIIPVCTAQNLETIWEYVKLDGVSLAILNRDTHHPSVLQWLLENHPDVFGDRDVSWVRWNNNLDQDDLLGQLSTSKKGANPYIYGSILPLLNENTQDWMAGQMNQRQIASCLDSCQSVQEAEVLLKHGGDANLLLETNDPGILKVCVKHLGLDQDMLDELLLCRAKCVKEVSSMTLDIKWMGNWKSVGRHLILNALLELGAKPNHIYETPCQVDSDGVTRHNEDKYQEMLQFFNLVDGVSETTVEECALMYLPKETIHHAHGLGIYMDVFWLKDKNYSTWYNYRGDHIKLLMTLLMVRERYYVDGLELDDSLWTLLLLSPTWLIRGVFEF